METKFNIEDPHLKENPFKVPEGYFLELRDSVSNRIAGREKQHPSLWTIARPQLGLVTAFAIVFFLGYGIISVFSGLQKNQDIFTLNGEITSKYIEEGFLRTTFIDFFDYEEDSLYVINNHISDEELLNYISENIDLITLSSLD